MFNYLAMILITGVLLSAGFYFWDGLPLDNTLPSADVVADFGPVRIINNNLGLKTTAKGIAVFDQASGLKLYEKNSAEVLPIASITKLMTALVVAESQPDWDKAVTVVAEDSRSGGLVQLRVGDEVTLKDLFNLMLVSSANEAAIALARNSGITDFIGAMNAKARQLEMYHTNFADPSGLDPENVSTADDLAKLAGAAFGRPEIAAAVIQKNYHYQIKNTGREATAVSTDKLLESFLNEGEYRIVGAKTGYLNEVSYCLLLQVQKNSTTTLMVVLLGAETMADRWQEAKGLVDWVFRNYQWQ